MIMSLVGKQIVITAISENRTFIILIHFYVFLLQMYVNVARGFVNVSHFEMLPNGHSLSTRESAGAQAATVQLGRRVLR